MKDDDIFRVMFSIQRALLGAITENMRYIAVDIDENNTILLYFYIDGEISDDDRDNISTIGTEVIADFDSNFDIREIVKRVDCPEIIVQERGRSVFLRKE